MTKAKRHKRSKKQKEKRIKKLLTRKSIDDILHKLSKRATQATATHLDNRITHSQT